MLSDHDQHPSQALPSLSPDALEAADAQRLSEQLSRLAELSADQAGASRYRSLLEFLRALLDARAVLLLPAKSDVELAICTVTQGITAAQALSEMHTSEGRQRPPFVKPSPALGADGYALVVELVRQGQSIYRLGALMRVPQARDLHAFMVLLQALGGFILYAEERRAAEREAQVMEQMARLLDLFRRAGAELDGQRARQTALDEVCTYLHCTRAALGRARGRRWRLLAVSGAERVAANDPAHHALQAAQAEAIAAGAPRDYEAGVPAGIETVAHEFLAQERRAQRILTLPLPRGSGAVTLEWAADNSTPGTRRLIEATGPFIPLLFDLIERARPNSVVFGFQRFWTRLGGTKRRALLAAGAALALLLAWPFPYRIKADCRLVPKTQRVLAAPFEGTLRRSTVRPGDRVKAGDTLAELEPRELKLREAELLAAREKALKQRDRALRNEGEGADFAEAQLAELEARSLGEELALVQRRIGQLTLTAPLDGVIVSGDLRRAEGQMLAAGQVLFEIAPLDEMLIEIDIPDVEVRHVRAGQPVRYRIDAAPSEEWISQIDRLHPQSEQREARNVFVAEAAAIRAEELAELRPGKRGRAAIDTGRRPLGWILSHRFVDWLERTIFW